MCSEARCYYRDKRRRAMLLPHRCKKGVSKPDNDVYPCKKEVRKCVMLISISKVEILG